MSECVHGCDGVWIQAGDGLMPCPRCQLEAHERWLVDSAAAERRRARVDTTARPTPTPEVHEARARIWSTIPRPATKERQQATHNAEVLANAIRLIDPTKEIQP